MKLPCGQWPDAGLDLPFLYKGFVQVFVVPKQRSVGTLERLDISTRTSSHPPLVALAIPRMLWGTSGALEFILLKRSKEWTGQRFLSLQHAPFPDPIPPSPLQLLSPGLKGLPPFIIYLFILVPVQSPYPSRLALLRLS